MWTELWRLGLQIEDGTRLRHVAVRLQVLAIGAPNEETQRRFDQREDPARQQAEQVGITLHNTSYHNATRMDGRLAGRVIPLDV